MPTRSTLGALPAADRSGDVDEAIRQILIDHTLGALSYLGPGGSPHTTTVEYILTGSGQVVFTTFARTGIDGILLGSPEVALVVGLDSRRPSIVRFEGLAAPLDGGDLDSSAALYFTHMPHARELATIFARSARLVFYRIAPKCIRYADRSTIPTIVTTRTAQ